MPSDSERHERAATGRNGRTNSTSADRGAQRARDDHDLTITETDAELAEAAADRRTDAAALEAERTAGTAGASEGGEGGSQGDTSEQASQDGAQRSEARAGGAGDARGGSGDEGPGGLAGLIQHRARKWSLDDMDPDFARTQRFLWNFVQDHYFRMELHGWHRLPDPPTLVVGIHAAGIFPVEAWMFGFHWHRRFDDKRILHGTAHDMLMATPLVGDYFRKMGVMSAARETVSAALEAGRDVIVYPGGDVDSLRPWTERDEVRLAGRRGFVKMAIKHGVPIVPLAKTGGTDTMFTLPGGRFVARALGLKQLARIESMPLAVGLPWGIAPAALPFFPLPAKLRIEIMDPLYVGDDPERAEDDEYVDTIYREVVFRIEQGVEKLARKRSFPVLG